MRLNFTNGAQLDLSELVDYYADKGIRKKGLQIRASIINAAVLLKVHPKLGKSSPIATKKYKTDCRALVSGNYKIVYAIDETQQLIRVITVFDTRQSPDKL